MAFVVNAQYLSKDFDDSNITSGGWTTQNVVGAINWTIYTGGSTPCASIKNYVDPDNFLCETWLISPAVNLSSTTQPTLTFKNACNYTGDVLTAYVSTNYTGSGAPSAATWTQLTFSLSGGGFAWTNSGDVDLSAYKTTGVYIAFKYTGSATDGKTWEVDDILIAEYAPFVPVIATLPQTKDFNDNDINSGGWTIESVTGSANWFVATLGADFVAKITNYSGSYSAAECWYISPGIKIVGTPEVILTFRNAFKYTGDPLLVLVSNNYTGEGAPSAATWTDLTSQATWSAGEWAFVASGDVTLPTYTNDTVYVAFKYTGSATDGSTWELDDISLTASSSVGENDKVKFEMYPNPVTDKLSIKSEVNFESVQLYNVTGEIVLEKYCNSRSQVLDLSKFDKGVYIIKVNYLNQAGITSKIVIE
ncbi:MAG: hypothetical protein A2W91_06555 [Bacteroidetes bacterium GWF2_38_335]|nr:MAG: hypothetical protein A2W91_06555 [Bacteroidetes bacterium GWF2_38_335]OFY77692.1 MAG: hypothetical protein A2281_18070 [Bacteroidetes bacterium RIFOXYA12_FULL_38_20]